ncbi:small acid-soluble spore protein N [Jeotgalibacillus proteolyticus]|uniref:Small, acid-soluble spore protein N n=1 Tax=Jeotgalibacillus proteolyticus TaxID=2082395 RepID=A0A2S5GDD5_9BACL|nr:small acid-soluble spore protein N [Jeotgalibacillus proteolyticus]PPA70935.1 small, acid-soluble spore protein N [Jeotgalibacillus proteolyticus]
MGNPKKNSKAFVPSHLGTQSKNPTKTNKGKMLDKTGKQPDVTNG